MAIDSLGRIVVAGTADPQDESHTTMALARLDADGQLDVAFGDRGRVLVTFPHFNLSFGNSVAIDTLDRIVVAGAAGESFALARYDVNGALDSSFGSGGRVTTQVAGDSSLNDAQSVAVDIQGRIVAAGMARGGLVPQGDAFALARYHSDGSLDQTFGSGLGVVLTHNGLFASQLAIDHHQRLLVTGWFPDRKSFDVFRYDANGVVDTGFGNAGHAATAFNGFSAAFALAIDSVGRIVVGGTSTDEVTDNQDFALVRYLGDDFSYASISPAPISVGALTGVTVTVNSLSGFDSNVAFSAVTPSGITASFNPTSVTVPADGSASTTLSAKIGPTVGPGYYRVTVTGVSPEVTHSTAVQLSVTSTGAGTALVIQDLVAAGCINKGFAKALTSTLSALDARLNAGDLAAATGTQSAVLKQIHAQSGKMISTSCTVNGLTFNPVTVLTNDVLSLAGL